MADSQTLGRVHLFRNLPEEQLQTLESAAERKVFQAGETIFHHGDPADWLYIVEEGAVDIVLPSEGEEIVLASFAPGSFFGELGLFDQQPRNATARLPRRAPWRFSAADRTGRARRRTTRGRRKQARSPLPRKGGRCPPLPLPRCRANRPGLRGGRSSLRPGTPCAPRRFRASGAALRAGCEKDVPGPGFANQPLSPPDDSG